MPKNLIIDGKTLEGVTALKATDADTGELAIFLDTSDANAIAKDIEAGKVAYSNGEKIYGTNTGMEPNDLDGLVDGTITSFTMPSGMTYIAPYRFHQFQNLETVDISNVEEIGTYAFYCSPVNATLVNLVFSNTLNSVGSHAFAGRSGVILNELPSSLTNIGSFCFQYFGAQGFNFAPINRCVIGTWGFRGAKVENLSGNFGDIGDYAFYACTSLKSVDIDVLGNIGENAFDPSLSQSFTKIHLKIIGGLSKQCFYNNSYANDFSLSADSNVTMLGAETFRNIGAKRNNPSQNIFTFDFTNSSFTSVPIRCFGGNEANIYGYNIKFSKFIFPITLSTIESYAFQYSNNCDFYFLSEIPPTLSVTTAWYGATTYNIFVPFNSINAYRTATNWTAQTAYIKGFAPADTFEVGATLPTLNADGYGLTWYSDSACTTEVTTVTDASDIYYCIAGSEKLAYGITSVTAFYCSVVITDTNGKTYSQGENALTGTVLTITGVPDTAGDVPYIFTVNGEAFTSGSTITINSDLSITAIYYNGHDIPIDPIFANNTWSIIYQVFRAGIASQLWSVGDTKPVTLTNGTTMTLRIADMKAERYALADGSGSTNGVLEFVELFPTYYPINSSEKEGYWAGGGWAACDMHNTTLNTTIWALLPEDLKAAMSEISLSEYSYTSPTPRTSTNKLFLPAETEMFDAIHTSAEGSQTGCVKYDQFGYYVANNTNAARIKYNGTSAHDYWLRSPYNGRTGDFCMVGPYGSYGSIYVSYSGGVAPCFAI